MAHIEEHYVFSECDGEPPRTAEEVDAELKALYTTLTAAGREVIAEHTFTVGRDTYAEFTRRAG